MEEVALSSAWQGIGDRLGEGVSGGRALALPLPLPRVVELWGTQGTLAPDEVRVPSEGWQVCEGFWQEPREPASRRSHGRFVRCGVRVIGVPGSKGRKRLEDQIQ